MIQASILIPEIVIYEVLTNILDTLKEDYQDKNDKTKTILYLIFGKREDGRDLALGQMNIFEQAVDMIINGGIDKKREFQITVGYNQNRASLPTMHIVMPSESPKNAGIGDNRGYQENIIDPNKNEFLEVVTGDTSAMYSIIITSDNVNEVMIMYYLLKSVFLGFKTQLSLNGFQNVVSGGSDLNIADDLIPVNIFHRNFNISFDYDYNSVDPFAIKNGKTVTVKGKTTA